MPTLCAWKRCLAVSSPRPAGPRTPPPAPPGRDEVVWVDMVMDEDSSELHCFVELGDVTHDGLWLLELPSEYLDSWTSSDG